MAVSASLIPELEHVIAHGSPERRAAPVERITALFLQGASSFNNDHVQLFDEVLRRLIAEIRGTGVHRVVASPGVRRQCAGRSDQATRER